jgi:hypothetical protein
MRKIKIIQIPETSSPNFSIFNICRYQAVETTKDKDVIHGETYPVMKRGRILLMYDLPFHSAPYRNQVFDSLPLHSRLSTNQLLEQELISLVKERIPLSEIV